MESKKKLTLLVKACFEALNTYGGGNDALEASIMLMQMTLGRFDYDTVRNAFEIHLQRSADMPKPADIINIINPPKQEAKRVLTNADMIPAHLIPDLPEDYFKEEN